MLVKAAILDAVHQVIPVTMRKHVPTYLRGYFHKQKFKSSIASIASIDYMREIFEDMENRGPEQAMIDATAKDRRITEEKGLASRLGPIEINDRCNINCAMCDTKSAKRA